MMNDFLVKGFINCDPIVVRKAPDGSDNYIVCEGNRRLAAIQNLLASDKIDAYKKQRPNLEKEFSILPVLQIKGLKDEQVTEVVKRMLGARHGNQVRQWKPFSRGRRLYERYLKIPPEFTKETFIWDESRGEEIATSQLEGLDPALKKLLPKRAKKQLGVEDVKLTLQTIRIMEQLFDLPEIEMKGGYYSLFEELCKQKGAGIKKLIPINSKTFKFIPRD